MKESGPMPKATRTLIAGEAHDAEAITVDIVARSDLSRGEMDALLRRKT